MSKHVPNWIRTLQITYLVTIVVWFADLVFVFYAASLASDENPDVGASFGLLQLALYAPGLIYFVFASQRLGRLDEVRVKKSAAVMFIVQRVTGIPALIGAIIGFLPALVNIPYILFFAPLEDKLSNAAFVAWVMVYVFSAAYVVAEFVKFRLNQSAKSAAEVANAVPTQVSASTE